RARQPRLARRAPPDRRSRRRRGRVRPVECAAARDGLPARPADRRRAPPGAGGPRRRPGRDLGADIVKTTYPGSPASMAEVAASCPIPVIVAGGSPADSADQVLGFTRDALVGGAAGVAMGRNVFMAAEPRAMARRVGRLVHQLGTARPGALAAGAL